MLLPFPRGLPGITPEDAAKVVRRRIAALGGDVFYRNLMLQLELGCFDSASVDFVEDRMVQRCTESHVREPSRTTHDRDDVRDGELFAGMDADELKGVVHPLVEMAEANGGFAADEMADAEEMRTRLAQLV